jgi:hypothetical protein
MMKLNLTQWSETTDRPPVAIGATREEGMSPFLQIFLYLIKTPIPVGGEVGFVCVGLEPFFKGSMGVKHRVVWPSN